MARSRGRKDSGSGGGADFADGFGFSVGHMVEGVACYVVRENFWWPQVTESYCRLPVTLKLIGLRG